MIETKVQFGPETISVCIVRGIELPIPIVEDRDHHDIVFVIRIDGKCIVLKNRLGLKREVIEEEIYPLVCEKAEEERIANKSW